MTWPGSPGAARGGTHYPWGPNIALVVRAKLLAGRAWHIGPHAAARLDNGNVLGPVNDDGDGRTWVELACDVTQLEVIDSSTAGAGIIGRDEAASCTLELLDPLRHYDPANTDGPYWLNGRSRLAVGTPLEVVAEVLDGVGVQSFVLFAGTVDTWAAEVEPVPLERRAHVMASGAIKHAAQLDYGPEPAPEGAGDSALVRLERLLRRFGWAGSVVQYGPTSAATLNATDYGGALWEQVADVVDAELGFARLLPSNDLELFTRDFFVQPIPAPSLVLGCAHEPLVDGKPILERRPGGASSPNPIFGTQTAALAVDGNTGTYWQPASGQSTVTLNVYRPGGLEAELVTALRHRYLGALNYPADYEIRASVDGVTWSTVAGRTGNTAIDLVDEIPAAYQTCTWFAVHATSWYADGPGYAYLACTEVALLMVEPDVAYDIATDLELAAIDAQLRNAVYANRESDGSEGDTPLMQIARSDTSIARHGGRETVLRASGLPLQTDEQVASWAQWVVVLFAYPEPAPRTVELYPARVLDDGALWRRVLGLRVLHDILRVLWEPEGSAPLDRQSWVMGVRHTITAEAWAVRFDLLPADRHGAQHVWHIGPHAYAALDDGNVIGWVKSLVSADGAALLSSGAGTLFAVGDHVGPTAHDGAATLSSTGTLTGAGVSVGPVVRDGTALLSSSGTVAATGSSVTPTVRSGAATLSSTGTLTGTGDHVLPAPFVPTDLAGLQTWHDASDTATITLNFSRVLYWTDKSGNGRTLVQTTSGKQPAQSTLNGKNVIRFDDARADILTTTSLGTVPASSSGTWFVVAKPRTNTGVYGRVVTLDAGANPNDNASSIVPLERNWLGPTWYTNYNSASHYADGCPRVEVGQPAVWTITRDGPTAAITIRTNGGSRVDTFGGTANLAPTRLSVGGNAGGGNNVSADVAEVLWYNRVLDATERAQVEKYLTDKWAGTPTGIAGLVGWWDASDPSTLTVAATKVSQWKNKAGAVHAVQATGAAQPNVDVRAWGGKQLVTFTGAHVLNVASGMPAQPTTLFVVAVNNTAVGAQRTCVMFTNASGQFYMPSDGNIKAFAGAVLNSGIPWTQYGPWRISAVVFAGASSSIKVGEVAAVTGNVGTHPVGAGGLSIGARLNNGGDEPWNGDIAEILVYNTALSAANVDAVIDYLQAKWGMA